MTEKIDLRVKKTQKNIKDAFYKLVKEKGFHKVTIQELATEAMINRNTFYLHYEDKYDLLKKLSSVNLNKLKLSMLPKEGLRSLKDLDRAVFLQINQKLFATIKEDKEFYEVMFAHGDLPNLIDEFTDVIRGHMSMGHSDKVSHIYIEYMVSGLIGVIKYWVQSNENQSIEEISSILLEIYSEDLLELLKRM